MTEPFLDQRATRVPSPLRRAVLGGAALALLIGGCTPSSDQDADASPTPDTSEPTPSASAEPSESTTSEQAAPVPAPEVSDAEIARSVHLSEGPDGVPETSDTASGVITVDGHYTVEGSCRGERDSMPFTLSTAAVDLERTTLLEGSIACGTGVDTDDFRYQFDYDGPAQLTITQTDGLTQGWVTVVADD